MEFNFKTVLMIVMAMIKVLAKNVRVDVVSNTVATIKIANTKDNQQVIDVLHEQVVNYLSTVELPYGERLDTTDTWIENGWIKFEVSSYWINSNKVVD